MTMLQENWLKTNEDEEFQEIVRNKIAAVQVFEKELPSVFIIHDLVNSSVVYLSQRGLDLLGVTLDEVRLPNADYHDRYFNPDDAKNYVPKILNLIERNNSDEMISYFQQVRTGPGKTWQWYLSSTKIFLRDSLNRPRLIITIAIPVETHHPIASKVEKLLEENAFLRNNHHIYSSLSRREKEILTLMAKGINSTEIASRLNISQATANTHRRNIRSKLKVQSTYEITRFAQAFDLI